MHLALALDDELVRFGPRLPAQRRILLSELVQGARSLTSSLRFLAERARAKTSGSAGGKSAVGAMPAAEIDGLPTAESILASATISPALT